MLLTNYEYSNASTALALKTTGADTYLAQGIKINRATSVGSVYVYLTPSGTPGGYLYIEIQDTSNALITDGTSLGVPVTSLSAGWNEFTFDQDARPSLSDDTQYYIAIKHSGYTYSAANNVTWACDQSAPHYTRGVGKTYNASWTALAIGTDFIFRIYSGTRTTIYSRLNEVEALMRNLTASGRFTSATVPTVSNVMDFEDTVADMIDGWLTGAGVTAPLTDSTAKNVIRSYANHCVARECEMTQNTIGFTNQSDRTRAGAFNILCDTLRKDLEDGGNITDALLDLEDSISIGGGSGLTAGMVDKDDRDDRDDDTTLIQPLFKINDWKRS